MVSDEIFWIKIYHSSALLSFQLYLNHHMKCQRVATLASWWLLRYTSATSIPTERSSSSMICSSMERGHLQSVAVDWKNWSSATLQKTSNRSCWKLEQWVEWFCSLLFGSSLRFITLSHLPLLPQPPLPTPPPPPTHPPPPPPTWFRQFGCSKKCIHKCHEDHRQSMSQVWVELSKT